MLDTIWIWRGRFSLGPLPLFQTSIRRQIPGTRNVQMSDSIQLFNPALFSRISIGRRTRPRRGIFTLIGNSPDTAGPASSGEATARVGSATWNLNGGDGNQATFTVVPSN